MSMSLRSTALTRALLRSRSSSSHVVEAAVRRPGNSTIAPSRLTPLNARPLYHYYSTAAPSSSSTEPTSSESSSTNSQSDATPSEADQKLANLEAELEKKNKAIAELKDARLRILADYENLQKISTREKAQAKDYALTSFAKDLISSVDILSLALSSVPKHKIVPDHPDAAEGYTPNQDLIDLHTGVELTKKEIEKVLQRHGVVAFNPVGEPFDPNKHEALYQAPVPGKEPGTVLETQELGYMIKDRLLRPAKVGVVLSTEN